ncbi:MAG: succinate dehydrogenase assembly factor 2 [Cocleimonas sp.]|nr:succinate dehydrogenase assembly factor 2 [Cocleimonas sp.]
MSEHSRLRWQCRRGTKELDLVLNNYLEHYYQSASQCEQNAFKKLITLEDPLLSDLLLEKSSVESTAQQGLITQLRKLPR